jgi:hypothetical protein
LTDEGVLKRRINLDNLISDGTSIKELGITHITVDQFLKLANIIESDGTFRYPAADLNDMLADTNSLVNSLSAIYNYYRVEWGLKPSSLDGLPTDSSFDIEAADHTLAGGALNNSPVCAAVASKKIYAAWILWTWDTAPAANYAFAYHEEDQGADHWNTATPTQNGHRRWFMFYQTSVANNKALQVNISGGAGAEVLRSVCCRTTI